MLPTPQAPGPATMPDPGTPLPAAEPVPLPTLPVPGRTITFGQLTVQQLLHSSTEDYSAVKEEVWLFVIHQFLKQSHDGATVLLKTGNQLRMIFKFQNNNCCIFVPSSTTWSMRTSLTLILTKYLLFELQLYNKFLMNSFQTLSHCNQ